MYQSPILTPQIKKKVFTESELLFMELKARLLFGETARGWWDRLSPAEKYQILNTDNPQPAKKKKQ